MTFTFEGYISKFQGDIIWNPDIKQELSIHQSSLTFSRNEIGGSMIRTCNIWLNGFLKRLKNVGKVNKIIWTARRIFENLIVPY